MSERTRVVVVGGTSGIGRHFARFCAERGDDVVITGRSAARTKTVADEIGGRTRGLALDLAEPERIADALADVPHVDRLVIAALDRDHNTVRAYRPGDAARLLTVKLVGYTAVLHALAPRMTDESAVVLLGGLASHRPYPGSTTVTTANGGISALVRTLAVELSPIRVNALHPSIVSDTPFWSDKPAAREAAATRALTRRPVTMRDCTEAIDFLLTNRAINGINLNIDGGDVLI
ncbi:MULTISPECIES: SDR family NAD(P)-dependent oxidoreductase [Micromonospora]|uniref:KR domain-containing protein n=2 Tax=Micromonospora TaxID=1873 RepID=A0ABX9Y3W7_MICCH|nr:MULTISPECIES: SDR family oxidoreductase [Micromonospora]MBC8988776.1 SDR family oxidoreductase [Micromonospora chalcea]ODB78673.1 short-chain dehydrogenase [Micromonospora sp. II]RQW92869.1 KR domain-containing protein [Micromonospora chalcea]RQX33165.1 KR domain-containing protein [Micromonospora chalcea]WDQ02004.1 SDR family oxidoreductase [Micromonospora chalcea]